MQFFQRKFSVNSVTKIHPKMWELWVHPDCDHSYELPNKANSSHKPTFFSWK